MEEVEWKDLINTNVSGAWRACRVAWQHLRLRSSPRMILLTSEAGWADTPGVGAYNVSKAALNSLGMSFAAECKAEIPQSDIQLNILIPGEARTEMNEGSTDSPFSVCSMALMLLSHPPGGPNGKFFHRDGRHFSFAYASAYGRPLW